MGLIQRAATAVVGTLQDQMKTAIRCEDMGNDILMMKKSKANGIIRDGSVIIVNPGQLAVLVDNGTVIDASAQEGVFEFQSAAPPSFLSGEYFSSMFKEMWTRFAFGGAMFKDQAVYFINATEIMNNGFGTPVPVMYRDWEHPIVNRRTNRESPMQVRVRCSGSYSFQIHDPAVFMGRVGGTALIYHKEELIDQMRAEIISVFQSVLNSLGSDENMVYASLIPSQDARIKQLMDEREFDKQIRARGVRILSFNVESASLDEESERKVRDYEESADELFMAARREDTYQIAADNPGGAGMATVTSKMISKIINEDQATTATVQQPVYVTPVQPPASVPPAQTPPQPAPAPAPAPAAAGLPCTKCGAQVTGNFCAACGTPAPVPAARFCPNCGKEASGNFCASCGFKLQ